MMRCYISSLKLRQVEIFVIKVLSRGKEQTPWQRHKDIIKRERFLLKILMESGVEEKSMEDCSHMKSNRKNNSHVHDTRIKNYKLIGT